MISWFGRACVWYEPVTQCFGSAFCDSLIQTQVGEITLYTADET